MDNQANNDKQTETGATTPSTPETEPTQPAAANKLNWLERFFEWAFGGSKNDNASLTPATSGDTIAASSTSQWPAASKSNDKPEEKSDGKSEGKPGDNSQTKSDEQAGDKYGSSYRPYSYREPDQPMRPHSASNRAELIFGAPVVYVSADAYKRMCLYVELAPKEVGWLGTIVPLQSGDFLIEDVYLIEQEVTSVETELSAAGTEKLVLEFLEAGDPGVERVNKMHFWGHSHVRMGTGPSGTDESTMRRFAAEGHSFYVRGIFNKLGRGTFDVYYYNSGFRILDVEWAVVDKSGKVLLEKLAMGGSYYGNTYGSNYGSYNGPTYTRYDDKPKALPAELIPDDALRAEVTAEYKSKVKERTFVVPFWAKKKKEAPVDAVPEVDENPLEITDADESSENAGNTTSSTAAAGEPEELNSECIPTGKDLTTAKPLAQSKPSGKQTATADTTTGDSSPGWLSRFWTWLTSPQPSPKPTSSKPPTGKKICSPENCQDAVHPWSKDYKGPRN